MRKLIHIDQKIMNPQDKINIEDLEKTSKSSKRIIGKPKIYDLDGNLLAEEENLVVLTGREFLAQKLAGIPDENGENYLNYDIRYFGIGDGGTEGNPPNTVGPFDNDNELSNRVKISNTGISTSTNSYKYIDNGFLKKITSDGSISIVNETHIINTASGEEEVAKKTGILFKLVIQKDEPADKPVKFNEAALYAVKFDEDGNPTDTKIMFARFTTLDKYLDINDGISIEWTILV